MTRVRRWANAGIGKVLGVVVAGVACAFLASAASAWACVSGPTMIVTPNQATAGQTITLSGFNWNSSQPIVVHWNALNGSVLGTFTPAPGRFGDPEFLKGTVTIPSDAKVGPNVLIATQSSDDGKLAQVPVRALVTVNGAGGGPLNATAVGPQDLNRAVGPVRSSTSVSTTALVLIGLGGAGVALFVAGIATFMTTRRPTRSEVPGART